MVPHRCRSKASHSSTPFSETRSDGKPLDKDSRSPRLESLRGVTLEVRPLTRTRIWLFSKYPSDVFKQRPAVCQAREFAIGFHQGDEIRWPAQNGTSSLSPWGVP
jgi:hypothetical protein